MKMLTPHSQNDMHKIIDKLIQDDKLPRLPKDFEDQVLDQINDVPHNWIKHSDPKNSLPHAFLYADMDLLVDREVMKYDNILKQKIEEKKGPKSPIPNLTDVRLDDIPLCDIMDMLTPHAQNEMHKIIDKL